MAKKETLNLETAYDLLCLAKEYECQGNLDMAVVWYEQTLMVPGDVELHHEARRRINLLIEEAIKDASNLRKDIVEHCATALDILSGMDRRGIGRVLQEIARRSGSGIVLGDTSRRYRIDTIQAESDGLAMAVYMYVGIRLLGYTEDLGLDFRPEYEMAKRFVAIPGGSSTVH